VARRRTPLERIVDQQVRPTSVGTVSVAVERAAEEFAREMLADEEFRRSLRELVRRRSRALFDRLLR
jgi:uncharacterized membrane protein